MNSAIDASSSRKSSSVADQFPMEDEIHKRNTDCVYFLASPLTCKKGGECEFRHSDSARLNTRDCYYWLNGSCLNPHCVFRHPPLEGFTDSVPEPVQPSYASVVPTTKSNVPCYFYFNAYCIKGDQCPFLHDTLPAQKPLKAPPETTPAHPPEKKTSTGSDTGPASVEVAANHHGGISEPVKEEHSKEVSQKPAPHVASEDPSPSVESSVPEFDEPAIKMSHEEPLPPVEYGSPQICLDQGSEELVEPDEWWESSPGFDVLVDDGIEQLHYDEDADYMLVRERESEIIQRHLLHYDYEVPTGYDPIGYPDAGYMYDHGMYDGYNPAENRYTPEYFENEHSRERGQSRERCLEPMTHRKRKSSRRTSEMEDERGGGDLRDHLRKRRRTDGGSHKRHFSRARHSSKERPMRREMGPLIQGRLGSEVADRTVSAEIQTNLALSDSHWRGLSGYPQSSRRNVQSRLRERESRRKNRKPSQERLVSKTSDVSSQAKNAAATFSGPKTLAQIKEEKRRAATAEGNNSENYVPRHPTKPVEKDFEGPKPLNELLKDKRRSDSSNGNTDGLTSKQPELLGSGRVNRLNENLNTGHESDYLDDDDDDGDDTLRRKLADILA